MLRRFLLSLGNEIGGGKVFSFHNRDDMEHGEMKIDVVVVIS